MNAYELIGSKGCGSAIIEMALEISGLPYRLTLVPYLEDGAERDRLLALNPLGQVPTLVLPDGSVMTESAAMALHIGDMAPGSGLVPPASSPLRPRFLNELVLLVAAIYPTFTFGDDPKQWTVAGEAADLLRSRVDGRRLDLFRQIDGRIGTPHWLGETLTVLDLYLVTMTRWRPGWDWFAGTTPRVAAAARAAAENPIVAGVLARNFDSA